MGIVLGGVGSFMGWLGTHQQEAYLVLFLGAYFETLIGPSFFIPGELFLLSGAILGGTHVLNIWYVALALYSGAILGDNSSYFIGHHASTAIFKEHRRIFSLENYEKGAAFFRKYGNKAIFLARLLGPLSWITPFLAGVYRVPYRTFVTYNTPGIFVGIGEFLVVGYFFGDQYRRILGIAEHYVLVVPVLIVAFFALRWIWKVKRRGSESEPAEKSV